MALTVPQEIQFHLLKTMESNFFSNKVPFLQLLPAYDGCYERDILVVDLDTRAQYIYISQK